MQPWFRREERHRSIAGLPALAALLALLLAACAEGNNGATPQAEAGPEVRFFAIGDWGSPDADPPTAAGPNLQAVADAIAAKCAADGCDFGITTGDNFYNVGVTSTTDPLWDILFVQPFGALGVPFYPSLGNHDYAQNDYTRGQHQVDYSAVNPQWVLPSNYYMFRASPATFLVLDTQLIVNNISNAPVEQGAYFAGVLAADDQSTWQIAYGHHPYISNGPHGNAGNYDDVTDAGIRLKNLFEAHLCGKVDLYLAGHDHNLQVLQGPSACPGTFVVSGAGGRSLYPLENRGNTTLFEHNADYGFAYVVVTKERIRIEMLDTTGTVLYTGVIKEPL